MTETMLSKGETDRVAGVGHMVRNAAPELVISEIDAMIDGIARNAAAPSETHRF